MSVDAPSDADKGLIFHGTHGSPEGNWFGWLQDELMMEGWQVAVPKFPTPEDQSLKNWTSALEAQISDLNDIDLVVGHSSGATFALRLIEAEIIKPEQLILVSAVIDTIDNDEYDRLNESFIEQEFDWARIKQNCGDIILIHGDNDPYVPLNQPEMIADQLDIPLNLMKDGGHLNSESGFDDFPELMDFIHA